jgi:hypothetical protein
MTPSQVESRVRERCQRDEVGAMPSDEVRTNMRCIFDDPDVGPSHVPWVEASKGL